MRARDLSIGIVGLMFLVGCSRVAGTWTADKAGKTKNPIAAVTFAHDGTFTANADYGGGKTHATSGHYKYGLDGKLKLEMDGKERTYDCKVSGDALLITYHGETARMNRMKHHW